MASRAAQQFESLYRVIREDIFAFSRAMNFDPTWQQAKLMQAVQAARDGTGSNWIAVKSGQGPGKTTVSAIVGLWRCLQDMDALTIVTAPTMRQCKDVWLVEARRRLEAADRAVSRLFKATKTKIEICGRPDWGVRLVTATREENAQGYHEENMSVIVEEASGVPREIVTQFKGTLSNPNSLLLQIGNPNTRDCDFFNCFGLNRSRWECMTFNAEDTAKDYPHIVSPQRNKDLENEFGRESDIYRIRVLGEFPVSDPNCVMSAEEIEKCLDRSRLLECAKRPREADGVPAKQIGVDLARFGSDESCIFRRSGQSIMEWKQFAHVEPAQVLRYAMRMQSDAGWRDDETWYVVDAGGMGQGVMHVLHEAGKRVLEFHSNGIPTKRDYANRITQAWFNLAQKVRRKEYCLPFDGRLIEQLTTRQYFTNKDGRLVLESKDDYMKRGHPSPDRADALVLCAWDDVAAAVNIAERGQSIRVGRMAR